MCVCICVYVCRQVGTWRSASCEQRGKQAWQEGVSRCSWMCQGGSGASGVVRVPKNSDSSVVVMDMDVSTTTRTNPFVDNPPTTQVERLRAPYCGVEPELAGSLLGQGSDR